MISKFILSPSARLVRLFLFGGASVLFVLQLPSGYSQDAHEPVAAATTGQTDNDAAGVRSSNPGAKGTSLTAITGANSSPSADKGRINVKTFGAAGDGVTDDTAAFNAALKSLGDAGGGACLVPKGTYMISSSGITPAYKPGVSSNVHLVGEDRAASVLKISGMPKNHLLQCCGDNWSVENLTFDMGDYMPKTGLVAIACKGTNWRVSHCAIVRTGRWAIGAFGGSNWSIEGNYISRTTPGAKPTRGSILVTAAAGVWSNHARVIDNVCHGGGITFTGSEGLVARNRVTGSGSGSGIFVPGAPSTHAPTISGNICSDGSSGYDGAQGGRWWSVNGFEIWAPDSLICDNIAHDNDGGGFAIGGQGSIVIGNKAYNNGRGRHGYAGFNARINPAKGASASHSIFIGNSSYDQDYGYKEQASGLSDIKQIGNDYNRNRIGSAKSFSTGGQMPISSEMKSKLKALAENPELPENARQAVRQCLAR